MGSLIDIPQAIDFLEEALSLQEVTETHYISESLYSIDLDQVPRVLSGVTSVIDNVWDSASTAATVISLQIETSPSVWEDVSIIEGEYPEELEASFQLAQSAYPYSPKIIFNSAHAGQRVSITYTGMGSVPLARYFVQLYTLTSLLTEASGILLVDMKTYHHGYFDGRGVTSTSLWATPSQIRVLSAEATVIFPGLEIDFGTSGNAEVSEFTSAYYWKRIAVGLQYTDDTWSVNIVESAESESQEGLVNPSFPDEVLSLAFVDVQNNGTTGATGAINTITNTEISRRIDLTLNQGTDNQVIRYYGKLITGELEIIVPFKAGRLTKAHIFIQNSGTSGRTRADIYRCSNSDLTGVTIFSGTENQLILESNDEAPGLMTIESFVETEFTELQWFRIVLEEIGEGSSNIQVAMQMRFYN
jgi:hypothetical protein